MSGFDFGSFLRSLPKAPANDSQARASGNTPLSDNTGHTSSVPNTGTAAQQTLPTSVSTSGNGGPSNPRLSVEDKLAARAYSGAANALAASVAGGLQEFSDTKAIGRDIPSSSSTFTYDVAQLDSGEKPELQVSPLTIVTTEPFLESQSRIAVNEHFICYALKAGHVRALHKHTGARALLKGASQPPAVIFGGVSSRRLAGADKAGQVFVWDILHDGEHAELAAIFKLAIDPGPATANHPDGTLVAQAQIAYHQTEDAAAVLAIAFGQTIYVAVLPEDLEPGSVLDCSCEADLPLSSMVSVQTAHHTRCLTLNPSGDKLATVTSANQVVVWTRPGNPSQLSQGSTLESTLQFTPDEEAACSTVHWLSSDVLVTGSTSNSIISLWHLHETRAECVQTVKLISTDQPASTAFYNHMAVQTQAGVVVLANAKSTAVYVLHLAQSPGPPRFDFLAEVSVSKPILSLAVDFAPLQNPDCLRLYCVQERAIQQYTLKLAQCQPPPQPSPTPAPLPAPAPLPKAPSSAISEAASALLLSPADAQPSTPSASSRYPEASEAAPPAPEEQRDDQSIEHSTPGQQGVNSLLGLPSPISTPPASLLPDRPKLLTPSHLMQQAKRSASQASLGSLNGQHTPKSVTCSQVDTTDAASTSSTQGSRPASALSAAAASHQAETTDAVSTSSTQGSRPASALSAAAASSQVDNIDAVSTASTQGSVHTAAGSGRPASAMSSSSVPRSAAALEALTMGQSATPSPPGSRASTPPPSTPAMPSAAYLTPEQYNGPSADAAGNDAQAVTSSPAAPAAASDSQRHGRSHNPPDPGLLTPTPATGSGRVTIKLIKRQDALQAAAGQLRSPPAAFSAFEQPLDLLPVSNASPLSAPRMPVNELPANAADNRIAQSHQSQPVPQQQQQQLAGPSLQPPAATVQASDLSDASVRRLADAVAERTLAQHKRLLSIVHDGHREMLRIIKTDLSKEGKRLQAAIETQVAMLSKSQGSSMAEDRRAVLAEQQVSMERLVSLISASLNRDLPLRMEELVRAEVAVLSNGLQQQLGSVVQSALADALPEQFAGPQVRTALEASLASQLQQALTRPLQESFTASFQQQLIPAFEGACRDMFAQVQATFAGGLAEHLQVAGGANASVAAQLRESLGTATQLVADLKTDLQEGQTSLIQLASQRSGQQLSGPGNSEAQQDPRQELSSLIRAQQYEEAFQRVLNLEDISMVAWLCSQLDPGSLLSQSPPMLSQLTLLSLIQQLGTDLLKDTLTKLRWIQSTALALSPHDPSVAPHVGAILDHLYKSLQQVRAESSSREATNQAQICLHLVNSLIHSCPF